jgi:hypothetical protein
MKVLLLVNRFLIEDENGKHQISIPFSKCTPEEDARLREIAAAQRQPRNVKRTKRNSRRNSAGSKFMHKGYSPADKIVAGDILGTNANKVNYEEK